MGAAEDSASGEANMVFLALVERSNMVDNDADALFDEIQQLKTLSDYGSDHSWLESRLWCPGLRENNNLYHRCVH